jgi:hypothetical protein
MVFSIHTPTRTGDICSHKNSPCAWGPALKFPSTEVDNDDAEQQRLCLNTERRKFRSQRISMEVESDGRVSLFYPWGLGNLTWLGKE